MKISKEVNESLTLKFSQLAREMNDAGNEIISLGLGEPYFETPGEIMNATISALHEGYTKYSNPLGLDELREAIAKKFREENKIEVGSGNILVTPGAKQACLLVMMALLQPGDEVINFSPSFVSYVPQIKIAEPRAIIKNIDLSKADHSPEWDKVFDTVNDKTRLIIINSPNNPTGYMFTRNDMEKLLSVIQDKPYCYILSDEIYEKLNFSGFEHISPGSYSAIADRVFTINGFSKAYSMTGWRIGYMSIPEEHMRTMIKLQQHINTNTTTFIQKGVITAFSLDKNYLYEYKAGLQTKVELLMNVVEQSSVLNLVEPKGGLFAFLDISKTGFDSDTFSLNLLKEKSVAATPGIAFGNNWNNHVRISLATELDEFQKGMNRLEEFATIFD